MRIKAGTISTSTQARDLMWQAWTNGSMGLWLIFTAFIRMSRWDCMTVNFVIGILVAIVSWRMKTERPWQGWLSGVMGLWMVASVFIPSLLGGDGFLWNNAIGGTLVAIIGFTALGGRAS